MNGDSLIKLEERALEVLKVCRHVVLFFFLSLIELLFPFLTAINTALPNVWS